MKSTTPKPISSIIDQVIEKISRSSKKSPLRIEEAWRKSVNERIAKHTLPVSFRSGRLVVNVDNAVWRYQLGFLKEEILSKLRNVLGEATVEDIYFRMGKV